MKKNVLSAKIAEYISDRAQTKRYELEKKHNKIRAAQNTNELHEIEESFIKEKKELEEKFDFVRWLSDAARRASQVQVVTHALKYTHSGAKGSSFYVPSSLHKGKNLTKHGFLTTGSLQNPATDGVGNAANFDVLALLQIKHDDKTLLNHICEGDLSPLQPFTKDDDLLISWSESFRKVIQDREPCTHTFAKQVYFPVSSTKYHLLSPIYSSSLVQALHERIKHCRFSEEAKEARKAKKEQKFSNNHRIDYLNLAQQRFGGTKPQNISQLNSSRGGKGFLLSCSPPVWNSLQKPPLKIKTVFSFGHLSRRAYPLTSELKQYLLSQKDRVSTKQVRDRRSEYVDRILECLIQYSAEIQNLYEYTGWSSLPECKLPLSERFWLDPYRCAKDELFAKERETNEWQSEIANRFANWLINRLKDKKLLFGDSEHREWRTLAKKELQLLNLDCGGSI